MKFTNDDLEDAKRHHKHTSTAYAKKCKTCALLARLEAESNCADLLEIHYDSGVFDDLDEGDVALIVQALEARRKAAGK